MIKALETLPPDTARKVLLDLIDALLPKPMPATLLDDALYQEVLDEIRQELSIDPSDESISARTKVLDYLSKQFSVGNAESLKAQGRLQEAGLLPRPSIARREIAESLFSPVDIPDDEFIVLHLSDLHVSKDYAYSMAAHRPDKPHLGNLLKEDLACLGILGRVDALVLTGDFTQSATMDEFRRAREMVEEILAAVAIGRSELVIIPGNHDVSWEPAAVSDSGMKGSREAFETFKELMGQESGALVERCSLLSRSGTRNLEIVTLDSTSIADAHRANAGEISQETLHRSEQVLAEARKVPPSGTSVVWLAMHHHIFPSSWTPVTSAEQKEANTISNASEILALAARWNVEAILHGHQHQPSITVARRWPSSSGTSFKPIVSIGAGSLGGSRDRLGPFSRNHYFILHRRARDLVVRSRMMGDTGLAFVAHQDLLVPLDNAAL